MTSDTVNVGDLLHDTFTVYGNYVGQQGGLQLHTVLESDDAPSDKLVISGTGANASGETPILITNVGGEGALTLADGIRVVDATAGATTEGTAFTLGAPVAAGIFEYQLYRGGVTGDPNNDDDLFLRSGGVSPPPPGPPPITPSVRPEIPGYILKPALVQKMGVAAIGTFHERQGDEVLLNSSGHLPGAWGRLFGESFDQSWSSKISRFEFEVSPSFSGELWGLQAGQDLIGALHDDGSQDRVGVFFAYTGTSGSNGGNTLGRLQVESGSIDLHANSIGAYWTHIGADGWYVDSIGMYSWLDGGSSSDRGIGADTSGNSTALSVEAGYPFSFDNGWALEPQGQLIWQHVDLDDANDRFTGIDYESFGTWTGRIGVRLEANTTMNDVLVQPFASINLWHDFDQDYKVSFNRVPVVTELEQTSLELNVGFSAQMSETVSVYGGLQFATGLDDDDNRGYGGNIGLRIKW